MLTLIAISCVSVCVAVWAWYEWRYREVLRVARSLPTGQPSLPLLGHLHLLVSNKEEVLSQYIKVISTCMIKSVGTFCFWIGPFPVIFVQNPYDIQVLLNTSKVVRPSEYKKAGFASPNGLLTAPAHIWKITRKHLNPIFNPCNLVHFEQRFNKSCENLVDYLSNASEFEFIDFWQPASGFFLHNIWQITYGPDVELDTSSNEFMRCLKQVERFGSLAAARFVKIWLRFDFVFNILYKNELKEIEQSYQSFLSIISKKAGKTSYFNKTDHISKMNTTNEKYVQPILLPDVHHYLRSNYSDISEDNIHDDTKTFLATGTDTTAVTLCTCLMQLAWNPAIQEKLYTEIRGSSSELTLSEVNKYVYLDKIIKEALRTGSTVPLLLRKIEECVKLNDCTLPADTLVAVNLMGLHHQPSLYPDPDQFNPDHFSAENTAKRPKYSFLPFAGGPKDCIGKQYSMIIIKFALVHILRAYKVFTNMDEGNMKYTYKLTLLSTNGYHLKFEKRDDRTLK